MPSIFLETLSSETVFHREWLGSLRTFIFLLVPYCDHGELWNNGGQGQSKHKGPVTTTTGCKGGEGPKRGASVRRFQLAHIGIS